MKKIIKKFWGVALVVMMLSSLFVVSVPASAGNYAFSDSFALPGYAGDVSLTLAAAGNGFIDVAKSGDTLYAIGLAGGVNTLYKSSDGGATWAAAVGTNLPATGLWKYVAVAPDDPLIVVVVNNPAGAYNDTVYLSTNGGASFALLNALTIGTDVNTVDISPLSTARYILVGGSGAAAATPVLETWTLGGFAWSGNIAGLPGCDDVVAAKYVPTFASEEDLLVVTETALSDVTLHIYSYPSAYNGWDNAAVDPSYPRVLEVWGTVGTFVCQRATIELDETFFALANEIGFVGASILDNAVEIGGVYTVAGAQIFTTVGVNSVAWDGINLMAAPYQTVAGAITIYRSSTALAATPVFSASTAVKSPGTGTLPLVAFAGGDGYCFSQGVNSAIARTTDLGKSFNGVKLVNSNFNDMIDFWISSDASVIYAITNDGATNALWRKAGGVWERILIFTGATYSANWIVRAADSAPTAVFLAKKGARNVVYSLDNGEYTWTTRFSQQNIADFAAASASLVYYVSDTGASGAVFKGAATATSIAWTNLGALTGAVRLYSITLVPGGFVVGGLAGGVGYYNGTAVTTIAVALGTGQVVATASGTATGDTIYAASATNGGVGSWVIGTNTAWTVLTADNANNTFTGIAYANGVAYAYDDDTGGAGDSMLYRYIPGATDTYDPADALTFTQTNMVNALQISTGSNTLWARDSATNPDTIQSYTELLLLAVPTLSYPINAEIIPVNSLNGAVNPFIFQWAAPAGVTAPTAGWTYTVQVFYDAAGTILVGTQVGIAPTNAISNLWGVPTPFTAGETYYWRVQIDWPIHSGFTALGSFTVQQLEAIVPEISSPENGATIDNLTPGFSWSPISGVTSYRFELAKEPTFALLVYTDDVPGSGAALPVATQLERGRTYYWRVKALTPAEGEWSQVGIFTVAELPPTPTPTPTITPTIILPTPTITLPQPTVTVVLPTTSEAPVEEIATPYIWAIIIIGAVLVIAVIVLIVRTRRTV